MSKPKKLYANAVNLNGLWSKKPMVMRQDGVIYGEKEPRYWDGTGNFDVEGPGTARKDGLVTFASEHEGLAQAWTDGAMAVMRMLREWSK